MTQVCFSPDSVGGLMWQTRENFPSCFPCITRLIYVYKAAQCFQLYHELLCKTIVTSRDSEWITVTYFYLRHTGLVRRLCFGCITGTTHLLVHIFDEQHIHSLCRKKDHLQSSIHFQKITITVLFVSFSFSCKASLNFRQLDNACHI